MLTAEASSTHRNWKPYDGSSKAGMADVLTFERASRREAPWPGGGPYKGKTEFFNRRELHRILQVYSRKVMAGEWRDYAVGGDASGAVFAIYGHASPWPLYRIAKRTQSAKRKARYQVIAGSRVLQSAPTLDGVLEILERRRPYLVDQM